MKTKMTESTLIDTYILPYEDDEQKVLFYEGSMGYSDEYIDEVADDNNIELINYYSLDKKRFIEWLIDDHEDMVHFATRFRKNLLEKGFVSESVESLLKERDTVPIWLLAEHNNKVEYEVEEIEVDEIKLI